jgi:hypothetical protein
MFFFNLSVCVSLELIGWSDRLVFVHHIIVRIMTKMSLDLAIHNIHKYSRIGLMILIVAGLISCTPAAPGNPDTQIMSTEPPPPLQDGQLHQWAAGAQASSEYADPEWAAIQAIGEPDTLRCGDYQSAWATAGSDTIETLVLTYTLSVHVTAINIIETFHPNQVAQVELVGNFDRAITVYEHDPFQVDQPCPYTLAIPVEKTERLYDTVRITVDQSVLGLGWNQIDAVELVGETE